MHELILSVLRLIDILEEHKPTITEDTYTDLTEALDALLTELEISDTDPMSTPE